MMSDPHRYFLWYFPSSAGTDSDWWRRPSHVVELSAGGRESARHELPPDRAAPSGGQWYETAFVALAPPVLFAAGGLVVLAIQGWSGFAESFATMPPNERFLFYVGGTLMLLVSTLSAIFTHRMATRYAFTPRQKRWWTIANFCTSLAGVLTLLSLREWPARETCPSCGRKRVVTRDICEHCSAPFPPPARTGIEILEERPAA
jgi:hypothetical protein